jgi:hypothetical protein
VTEVRLVETPDIGYSVCTEHGLDHVIDGAPVSLTHRATNIVRREADGWRLVHHHTDLGAVSTSGARLLQPGTDTGTVEPAYREIVNAVRDSTLRRGPGGHILTGPIYVDGAEPGDVLRVRIKQVELYIPYACNSFGPRSGLLPENFPGKSPRAVAHGRAWAPRRRLSRVHRLQSRQRFGENLPTVDHHGLTRDVRRFVGGRTSAALATSSTVARRRMGTDASIFRM